MQGKLPRARNNDKPVRPEDAPLVTHPDDLAAALFVPERTASLDEDAKGMRLSWEDLGGGYWRMTGGFFVLYLTELVRVAETEGDDLLHLLGHEEFASPEARRFWTELMGSKEAGMSMQDMEGYQEAMDKFLARRNVLYLYHANYIMAFPKSLKGYKAVPDGLVRIKGATWN